MSLANINKEKDLCGTHVRAFQTNRRNSMNLNSSDIECAYPHVHYPDMPNKPMSYLTNRDIQGTIPHRKEGDLFHREG